MGFLVVCMRWLSRPYACCLRRPVLKGGAGWNALKPKVARLEQRRPARRQTETVSSFPLTRSRAASLHMYRHAGKRTLRKLSTQRARLPGCAGESGLPGAANPRRSVPSNTL